MNLYLSRRSLGFMLFKIMTLFVFLNSICPWLTWSIDFRIFWVISTLLFTIFYLRHQHYFVHITKRKLMPLFLFLLIIWIQRGTFMAFLFGIGLWWCVLVILLLKREYQIILIHFITKWTSLIVGVSLLFYFLHLLGIPLPYTNISYSESLSYSEPFQNYFFFIKLSNSYRFQSIFLEPGHLTLVLAPLLFLHGYNIRNKYVVVLLVAQIFTFSLAGYITLFFGIIWNTFFNNSANKKSKHFLFVSVVIIVCIIVLNILFSENIFKILILDRLQVHNGQILGYNRTNELFDVIYDNFLKSNRLLYGEPTKMEDLFLGHGVAGYKVFILNYGVIGFVLGLLCYIYPIVLSKNKKTSIGFTALLLLLLSQNAYPLWWVFLIFLIVGACYFESDQLYNKRLYENII